MNIKLTMAALAVSSLAGCEIPVMMAASANGGEMTGIFEVTLPAMALIQIEDGSEELLVGEMRGKASGNAEFDMTGPIFGDCSGAANREGKMTMTCTNGYSVVAQGEPARASMSGIVLSAGTAGGFAFKSAFGWGGEANEGAIRAALAENG